MGSTPPGGMINSVATVVTEWAPTKNYDMLSRLSVRAQAGFNVQSFIYWQLPFPLGATIVT